MYITSLLLTFCILVCTSSSLFVLYRFGGCANLAHGEFLILAGYAAAWAHPLNCGIIGEGIFAALMTCMTTLLLWSICRRSLGRTNSPSLLLCTISVSVIISEALRLTSGAGGTSLPLGALFHEQFIGMSLHGWLIVFTASIIAMAVALFAASSLGLRVYSSTQNQELLMSCGVSVSIHQVLGFAFAGLIAGVAGAVIAPITALVPYGGGEHTLKGFLAASFNSTPSIRSWLLACAAISSFEFILMRMIGGETARFAFWTCVILATLWIQWHRHLKSR